MTAADFDNVTGAAANETVVATNESELSINA